MTCSPNNSLYFNVTAYGPDPSGELPNPNAVLSGTYWVDEEFGTGFYESCKDVKYGMSNTDAMLFIGGGASNYLEMLTYMGTPNALGTPFYIGFPNASEPISDPDIVPANPPAYGCADEGYECVCVDCPSSCREPPPIESNKIECYVGSISCLSLSLIILYAVLLIISLILLFVRRNRDDETEYTPVNEYKAVAAVEPKEWIVYSWLQRGFYVLGRWVASNPSAVILASLLIVQSLCIGLVNFQVETDPVELWVGYEADTREQKAFFDENFGPFYRTEQYIISWANKPGEPIFDKSVVDRMFDIENGVYELVAQYNGENHTVDSLCFKPLGDACAIIAVTGYWQTDKEAFLADPDWYGHMETCTHNPSFPGDENEISCLPLYMDPMKPQIALGGFEGTEYMDSLAFVTTFTFLNSLDEDEIQAATEWEKVFVDYMGKVAADPANSDLRITYLTESSIELELARGSTADLVTIAISYLVMFLYVSIALGKFTSWRRIVVDTKFTLGVAGVLICIASVLVSVGIFSMAGIKTSLIIAEVIPFLVLAVGVDNIFIMVNTFEALDKSTPIVDRCAATMSEIGPSITLSATSESVAFLLGTIVTMPAVNSFAAYSAVAVFVDFLLQITCFLALVAIDARRKENNRADCAPCVKVKVDDPTSEELADEGYLQRLVVQYYTPFLLHKVTRFFAVFGTLALLVVLASFIPQIEMGLDQSVALPQDSYLIPYFVDQTELLEVGPPVYFVVRGGNATALEGKTQLCYSYRECLEDSVSNIIAEEARRPTESYVSFSSASWMDDFLVWINPVNTKCCRVYINDPTRFCQEDVEFGCRTCYRAGDFPEFGPEGEEFMFYLDWFLKALPGTSCAFAGAAAYSDAIVPDFGNVTVTASHFRTYHTVLATQADFINSYQNALRISDRIMEALPGLDVFPYSLFYIYFEQYNDIVSMAFLVLSVALLAVFLVTALIMGSLVAALFVCIPVFMIVVGLCGVMALWNISLNAVSLVNLVMALGISVEFCAHIVRAYTTATGTRRDRARIALNEIGASVFSGITITKLLGVIVLAFAQSQIFVIYYFRMYITIVMLGFLHGLFFLPALLSYVGPASVARPPVIGMVDSEKEALQIQQRELIYGSA